MRLSTRIFSSVSAKTFFVGAVVALAIGAFTLTGVGSLNQLDSSTAGSVGSQLISMRQMQEVLQNISRQNQGDTPQKRNENVRQAMNQLVEQKVMIEEGVRLGFEANDVEVANWIKKIPAFQNKDTKKFDNEQYEKFLKSGQVTALELYRQGRDSVTLDKYYQLLSLAEPMPAKLREETEKRNKQEFFIETAVLNLPEDKVRVKVKADAVAFSSDAKNSELLKKTFEESKTEFSKPAQVEILGLLIAFKEANRAQGQALNRSKAEAQTLANSILTKLKSGADFAAVALESSDDASVKTNKGQLGFVDKTTIDEPTALAAFGLNKENPLSGVIETPFGFRVIKFVSKRDAVEKSFEQVKEELAERQVAQGARAALQTQLETETETILGKKDPKSLDAFIAAQGLAWTKQIKPVGPSSRFVEGLGSVDSLLKDLFSLKSPGDVIVKPAIISGKKYLVRLVKRDVKLDTAEESKQKGLMEKAESYRAVQTFVSKTQKKLVETYRAQKEIKENPMLFANVE